MADQEVDMEKLQKANDLAKETMKKAASSTFTSEEEDAMGNVVDGMMKQLLSKEFMYEPMKDISERFPKWLAQNKDKLSSDDYEKWVNLSIIVCASNAAV